MVQSEVFLQGRLILREEGDVTLPAGQPPQVRRQSDQRVQFSSELGDFILPVLPVALDEVTDIFPVIVVEMIHNSADLHQRYRAVPRHIAGETGARVFLSNVKF